MNDLSKSYLPGGNASGTCKLKPMFIHRSEQPRALPKDKSKLPVRYAANKKCWMTQDLFTKWFKEQFIPEVRAFLKKKKLPFKVLLVLDNAPVHPTTLKYRGVKVVFMPPNTSCLLQPMDQVVIKTFKAYYQRNVQLDVFDKVDNHGMTLAEYWKDFKINRCIEETGKAWEEVSEGTLNKSWKKLYPSMFEGTAAESEQNVDLVIDIEEEAKKYASEVDHILEPVGDISDCRCLSEEEIARILTDKDRIWKDAEENTVSDTFMEDSEMQYDEEISTPVPPRADSGDAKKKASAISAGILNDHAYLATGENSWVIEEAQVEESIEDTVSETMALSNELVNNLLSLPVEQRKLILPTILASISSKILESL